MFPSSNIWIEVVDGSASLVLSKLDILIERLPSKKDKKVKNGSCLTHADFMALGIINLDFHSVVWRDKNEDLKVFIRHSLTEYLSRISIHKENAASNDSLQSAKEYERRFVQPESRRFLDILCRYKFSDDRVIVEDERPYGSVETEKLTISGGVTNHSISFVPSGAVDNGFSLGTWEDKSFTKPISNQKYISQVCAELLGEEKVYNLAGRLLNEVCGILTNGSDFIVFRRRSGSINRRLSNSFLCTTQEEIVSGLAHFLTVCSENYVLATSVLFDATNRLETLTIQDEFQNDGKVGDSVSESSDDDAACSDNGDRKPIGNPSGGGSALSFGTECPLPYTDIQRLLLRTYATNPPPALTAENLAKVGQVW